MSTFNYITKERCGRVVKYGDKRDYLKIDIYARVNVYCNWRYLFSTTWSRTCKEAKERVLSVHPEYATANVKACRSAAQ